MPANTNPGAHGGPATLLIQTACTLLFVPALRPDRFEKALASGADAVIIDLEDAVPDGEKGRARGLLAAHWASLSDPGRCLVRVNGHGSAEHAADLELCMRLRPAGIVLPKVESPDDLPGALAPALRFLPLIESARGWFSVLSIASAPGVARLIFGNLDFQADLDMKPDAEESELVSVRLSVVAASRAAGLAAPLDGVTRTTGDAALVGAAAARSRRLGFGGKLCIHPDQVEPVRAAFVPTPEEIVWARRVIAADANAQGTAVQMDGQMIDRPVVLIAHRILRRVG